MPDPGVSARQDRGSGIEPVLPSRGGTSVVPQLPLPGLANAPLLRGWLLSSQPSSLPSGQQDLNLRPLAPEASALTKLRHVPLPCVELSGFEPSDLPVANRVLYQLSYSP